MWDFSEDEFFFFVAAIIVALFGACRWYGRLTRVPRSSWGIGPRFLLVLAPPLSLYLILQVLERWGDPVYVAGHPDYLTLFMFGGAAWLAIAAEAFPWLGISPDHAVEDRNLAAAVAVGGGMVGTALAYAGGNIGNGPTIWTTLIPAFIALLVLLASWGILAMLGRVVDEITIDRDLAGGIRLAGFMVCGGAILGRAAAGDWHGWDGVIRDFETLGWPVLLLIALAAAFNRVLAPTPVQPRPSVLLCGFAPAIVEAVLTTLYLLILGWPEVAAVGRYSP